MTDHEKRIREALEAGPTEGPFQVVRGGTYCWDIKTADSYDVATTHGYVRNQVDSLPTANFIAACNPSAIRALLADLDEARAALSSQPSPELAGVSDEAIYAVWVQHCQTPGTTTRQLVCAFARAILTQRPAAQTAQPAGGGEPFGVVEVSVPHLRSVHIKIAADAPVPPVGALVYTAPPASQEQERQPSGGEVVTLESALEAIDYVAMHNGPGRATHAKSLLKTAAPPAPEDGR